MFQLRLNRIRRRWSISPEMNTATVMPTSTSPLNSTPLHRSISSPTTSAPPSRRLRRRRTHTSYIPRISSSSAIVPSPQFVSPLHAHFPVRYSSCDWQAVYSTMRDGVSLQTFFAKCAGPDPIVLLVRDSRKAVFGCYTTTPWKSSKQYYGNGEGFVFTLSPSVKVHKWSRANSFFQLSSSKSLAIGGGSKFALFLDSMFERGSSGPCATFKSPCLASADEFDIVVVEAYKLVPPFRFSQEKHH